MADVLTYDSAYLNAKRQEIKNDIAYARYKVGSTWYKTSIVDATILADGRVEIRFVVDHTVSGNITVTAIELYDHGGTRVASKTVSITRQDVQEGILYACRLALFQVVPNTSGRGAYDAL